MYTSPPAGLQLRWLSPLTEWSSYQSGAAVAALLPERTRQIARRGVGGARDRQDRDDGEHEDGDEGAT